MNQVSSPRGAPVAEAIEVPRIISVDDHVVEPPDLWQRWLPAKLRDRGPRVVRSGYEVHNEQGSYVNKMVDSGPEVDWWVYGDVAMVLPNVSHWAGRSLGEEYRPISFSDMRPGMYDPAERLDDMSRNHVERSMCFPNILPRFCGQTFLEHRDHDLGLACVEAYNNWMVDEWCGDSGGRLIPLCLVPLWDPELAAAEVRRNAARGVRAITFSELPANLGLPSIHDRDRHWDPLFRACDDTGTVICMHIGSGSKMPSTSLDAPPAVRIALTTQNAMMSMIDWLLSGVLIRFPSLRIAYSESQIGWMPFVIERVDRVFEKARVWGEIDPIVVDLPSTQIPGRVYGCFFEDDFGVDARNVIGVDQITFEVDYPHQDTTWPDSRAYLERALAGVPSDEVEAIVRRNAIDLLGLPAEL